MACKPAAVQLEDGAIRDSPTSIIAPVHANWHGCPLRSCPNTDQLPFRILPALLQHRHQPGRLVIVATLAPIHASSWLLIVRCDLDRPSGGLIINPLRNLSANNLLLLSALVSGGDRKLAAGEVAMKQSSRLYPSDWLPSWATFG